jgi:hypothetical protein
MAIYRVPVFSQRTLNLCWEACGRMMWHWRYRNNPRRRAQYSSVAGNYLRLNTGLSESRMNSFYRQLGMRALPRARGANLRHALRWTPVIFTSTSRVSGHAMVLAGYSGGRYTVVNPCAIEVADFTGGPDSCTAGTVPRTRAQVEGTLGNYIWYW